MVNNDQWCDVIVMKYSRCDATLARVWETCGGVVMSYRRMRYKNPATLLAVLHHIAPGSGFNQNSHRNFLPCAHPVLAWHAGPAKCPKKPQEIALVRVFRQEFWTTQPPSLPPPASRKQCTSSVLRRYLRTAFEC